jgi:hypothetical protein
MRQHFKVTHIYTSNDKEIPETANGTTKMTVFVILKMTKQMILMLMVMLTMIPGWKTITGEIQTLSFIFSSRTWAKRMKLILMTVDQ